MLKSITYVICDRATTKLFYKVRDKIFYYVENYVGMIFQNFLKNFEKLENFSKNFEKFENFLKNLVSISYSKQEKIF